MLMKDKIQVLQEVVERNKLRDNGSDINTMVLFLKDNGIDTRYCPVQKKQ